ncbi:MAG TPA: pyridoxal 5'-phosphate synthase glutaminase subunit PdxT [Candidatus Saccharimonadales bacterium]|nr:pyridoxal 5'-phosphate synthase glutaminase subunit PdxT [Candidatus Saccharimonadales bacterium]
MLKIGILALQGDFDAHRKRLEELGAEPVLVRKPEQLDEIDGLIIPGGESSVFLNLLGEKGFRKLADFVLNKPAFGTCAGCILLAREVENPSQKGVGALDVTVRRNAYGRQIDSAILEGTTKLAGGPLEQVYIRAPRIERVGDGVEVLAERDGYPVLVRQGKLLAATFHPELSADTRVHAEFLKLAEHYKDAHHCP